MWSISFFLVLVVSFLLWFVIEKRRRKIHPVSGGIDRSISLPFTNNVELYSNSFSHCSRKVRLVFAELGITVKHHHIDLIETGWYQTISPAYLKVNPSGLVPTLLHEGHPVYESDDILAYAQTIASLEAPQLVPEDPALLTHMQKWLEFCSISSDDALAGMEAKAGACIPGLTLPMFVAAIRYIPLSNILIGFLFHFDKKRPTLFTASKIFGLRRITSLKPIKTMMHTSRDYMRGHLLKLNAVIKEHGHDWILGREYSLADVSIGCLLLRLEETGWLSLFQQTSDISEVISYYKRIKARPAWGEAITAHAHPIVNKAQQDLSMAVASDPSLNKLIYGHVIKEIKQ